MLANVALTRTKCAKTFPSAPLQRANRVELRRFRYSAHPSYFNISEHAGQYAWKPVIIKTVVDEFGRALWVDSGNRLTSKAAGLIEVRFRPSTQEAKHVASAGD